MIKNSLTATMYYSCPTAQIIYSFLGSNSQEAEYLAVDQQWDSPIVVLVVVPEDNKS